jgi:hypothetical protein
MSITEIESPSGLPEEHASHDLVGLDVHERDVVRIAVHDHDHRRRVGDLDALSLETDRHRCERGCSDEAGDDVTSNEVTHSGDS